MNEIAVRDHLSELKARLELLDEERGVVIDLIRGYEGWLRLHARGPVEMPGMIPGKKVTRWKLSIRQAIIKTLKDAHGEPIHAKEILRRISEMGVRPNAKDPAGVIDLSCHSLKKGGKPIERSAPRTWRWTE